MANIVQNTYLQWLAEEEMSRHQQVVTYRDYYDGNPPTFMTDRQAQYLNIARDKNVGVNWCAPVVGALSDKLEVTGFTVTPKSGAKDKEAKALETAASELSAILDGWWEANRMDGVQGWIHTAGIRDAESFAIIDYDNEEGYPRICHDYAFDGRAGVKVHMIPGTYNQVAFASKRWADVMSDGSKCMRLNLYFPDRIEKWIHQAMDSKYSEAHWLPCMTDDTHMETRTDDYGKPYEAAVAPWVDKDGNPLGVPVIPFINKNDGTGRGISEIDNAIPLNDAGNKTFLDLMGAADHTGFGMYYTINANAPAGGWQVYPAALFELKSADDNPASMGVLPPGDLTQLIGLWNAEVAMLSGITGTPQSRFTPAAVRPAEGTQQQEETALVTKAKALHKTWGNAWEDVMRMCIAVERAYGTLNLPDEDGLMITANWKEAESRNELTHLQALSIKAQALSVPEEQLWAEAGYNAGQIRKFKAERTKQKAAMRLAEAQAKTQQTAQQGQQPQPSDEQGQQSQSPMGDRMMSE